MNPEAIMLSEISQSEEDKACQISGRSLERSDPQTGRRMVLARMQGRHRMRS